MSSTPATPAALTAPITDPGELLRSISKRNRDYDMKVRPILAKLGRQRGDFDGTECEEQKCEHNELKNMIKKLENRIKEFEEQECEHKELENRIKELENRIKEFENEMKGLRALSSSADPLSSDPLSSDTR